MKVLIATNNKGKLREILQILKGTGVEAVSLEQAGVQGEPVEDADTFSENAKVKAEYFAKKTNIPTIADDSGLCVDALDGAPGVRSARYAGENAKDADNNALMLKNLQTVPDEKREAHFHCAIVCAKPSGEILVAEGKAHGTILRKPRGQNGFGYDPLFYISEEKLTFAQLPAQRKHAISHRGRALKKLAALLPNFLNKEK